MSLCSAGFPESRLLQSTGYNQIWTLRYDESPRDYYSFATAEANTLTGYYSNKSKCSPYPGSLPGEPRSASEWQSYCHNNSNHELTLIELYYNTCIRNNAHGEREEFCNSITDKGGNKRTPIACGGTDPDIFIYNPAQVAAGEIGNQLEDIDSAAKAAAAKTIADTRKKIFAVALVIVVLVILMIVLFKE
jgi:hypothetical protein